MPTELHDWYDTPLYYDIVFDAGTVLEADFLEAAFAKYARPAKGHRLLEPACGSGRLAQELARRGWAVSGFDGNAHMLEFARERLDTSGLKARLWEDWMQSFTLPKGVKGGFDMAHCLVSTFKYLHTEKDAAECLRRVAASLRPGGVFFLGLHLTDYTRASAEHERWVAQRGEISVVCNTHTWPANPKTRLEDLRTRLKITDSGRTHTQETRWQFRTYSAAQMKALLRKVPELEYLECYDFTYDITEPRKFDDSYADVLLVLRKK
ncbi:class I SAM-dependent methyltransferase [Prosthecobacter sp.]|uniref:class I SAM-dependent methyltransferase n=1 Tax=Prosthecobacter sp. TaxID=1965333 RepID=UPI002488EFCC|nr:class I SAM-dependent methyltransferase [Prosthecobacter sp.]MDI1312658.1 class I SAM-dependent methyltransferase [Prosthecobacter sp.]